LSECFGTFIPVSGFAALSYANVFASGAPCIAARFTRKVKTHWPPRRKRFGQVSAHKGGLLGPMLVALNGVAHGF
jgi:hypothetical protein